MANRIEYLRGGIKVMVAPCPLPLEDVLKTAREGLVSFNADSANVLDENGKVLKEVRRGNALRT
jgi:hypothetical protein